MTAIPNRDPDQRVLLVKSTLPKPGSNETQSNKYYYLCYWQAEGIGLRQWDKYTVAAETAFANNKLPDTADNRRKVEHCSWHALQSVIDEKTGSAGGKRYDDGKYYKEIKLASKTEIAAKKESEVAKTSAANALTVSKPAVDLVVQNVISIIFKEAGEAISQHFDTKRLSLLSQDQIDLGRKTVLSIANLATMPNYSVNMMIDLVEEYFNYIPTPRGYGKVDVNDLVTDFVRRVNNGEISDRLDQLEAAIKLVDVSDVTGVDAASKQYTALGATLIKMDNKNPNYAQIAQWANGYRVKEIFEVLIPSEREAWDKDTRGKSNIVPLWHGTRNPNVRHILKSGLRIPPVAANGWRFGPGIYFSPSIKRSYGYISQSSANKFLFVCDVAVGKPWIDSGSNSSMRKAKDGFDSTWGKGEWSKAGDEIIVYTPSQQTIRALVWLN